MRLVSDVLRRTFWVVYFRPMKIRGKMGEKTKKNGTLQYFYFFLRHSKRP